VKLIEALKQIKDLQRKAEDLRGKIGEHSAITNIQTPEYPDQKGKVGEWLQAHSDILKEILRLRVAIQRTNLETKVEIELGGKTVSKSIAEWIHRRRDLAKLDLAAWGKLTDRGIREEVKTQAPGGDVMTIKIVRFFDPGERDNKIELYTSESSVIDGRLEIVNAITDLIE